MGARPGYHPDGTPQRILDILADGKARTVRDVAIELRKTTTVHDPYCTAAQALLLMSERGDVKRERVNRKFVYRREIAA